MARPGSIAFARHPAVAHISLARPRAGTRATAGVVVGPGPIPHVNPPDPLNIVIERVLWRQPVPPRWRPRPGRLVHGQAATPGPLATRCYVRRLQRRGGTGLVRRGRLGDHDGS